MIDDEYQGGETVADNPAATEEARPDFDRLIGVVTDGLIGALGGAVGTAVLTVGLLIAASLGAFDTARFAVVAELLGAELVFDSNIASIGYLVFLLGGMTVWPLLLASIGSFLPGDRFALKGIPLGMAIWTGFAPAFYGGESGVALVLFLVITFFAHVFYGFTLGAVFDYFSNRPDTLV